MDRNPAFQFLSDCVAMLSLINVRLFFFVFRLAFEHEKKSNVARFWPAVAAVSFGWHFSSIYVRTPNGQAQVTPKLTDLGFFRINLAFHRNVHKRKAWSSL